MSCNHAFAFHVSFCLGHLCIRRSRIGSDICHAIEHILSASTAIKERKILEQHQHELSDWESTHGALFSNVMKQIKCALDEQEQVTMTLQQMEMKLDEFKVEQEKETQALR